DGDDRGGGGRRRGTSPAPLPGASEETGRPRADGTALERRVEVRGEVRGRAVPTLGILLQSVEDDGLRVARDARVQTPGRQRILDERAAEDLLHRAARERDAAGQALIERRAETVHVHARVGGRAGQLLRRRVERRARERPREDGAAGGGVLRD